MPALHQLNCSFNERNVAFGGCFLDWKLIKGMFLYDNPRTFKPAEIAEMQTTLEADAQTDIKSARMYPIHNFTTPTDNSEAPVIQTFGDGSKAVVRDGVIDWTFAFTKGGYELLKALRTHNVGAPNALFYDKNNRILGYNNNGQFSTIPLQFFYASPWKMSTGSAVSVYEVRVVFDANFANEDSDYVAAGFPLTQITGLQDIHFVVNSWNQNTGLFNVTIETEIGGTNLFDAYESELQIAGIYTASNAQTGGVITVSSSTPVVTTKTFNVQLLHSDPDFPALGGSLLFSMEAPSALKAAGMIGFEAEILELDVVSS